MEWIARGLQWLGLCAAFAIGGVALACSDGPTSPSSTPQIAGCNSVSYQGTTYSNLGCAVGIASFTSTITQNGRTASFSITCSGGCISTVRVA
jgi:hypothetical protein